MLCVVAQLTAELGYSTKHRKQDSAEVELPFSSLPLSRLDCNGAYNNNIGVASQYCTMLTILREYLEMSRVSESFARGVSTERAQAPLSRRVRAMAQDDAHTLRAGAKVSSEACT